MGRSYSADVRKRVVGFVDAGHALQEAVRHFGVSASFAIKLDARRRETGSIAPAIQGRPKDGGKLAPHLDFLLGRVKAHPDVTMPELATELSAERGVEAAPAWISRMLRNAGFTYKKALMAAEHGRADVAERQREWISRRQPHMRAQPGRLMFIDETSVTTKMTRLRGRAPCGERLRASAPFGRWGTQTFIAGMKC